MMRTTQGRNEKDIVTLLTDRLNRWLLGGGHQCAMSWASWAHERVLRLHVEPTLDQPQGLLSTEIPILYVDFNQTAEHKCASHMKPHDAT
jgi:hypothetical protein